MYIAKKKPHAEHRAAPSVPHAEKPTAAVPQPPPATPAPPNPAPAPEPSPAPCEPAESAPRPLPSDPDRGERESAPWSPDSGEGEYADYDTFLSANPDTGRLRIRTFIGDNALPIAGAAVRVLKVFADGERLMYTAETDRDGNLGALQLPAPPRARSLAPGREDAYATYRVVATHPDFFPAEFDRVPIFSGVTSVQSIPFLPRPIDGGAK